MKCQVCGNKLIGKQKRYCSTLCKGRHPDNRNNNYEAQQARGRKRKQEFVNQLGGKCQKCGYNKCLSVLSFHHREPDKKSFALDLRQMSNRKLSALQDEVDKCDLLCLNCHTELHHG